MRSTDKRAYHVAMADAARTPFRILILGGYGQFGRRIVAALARDEGLDLVVAGRHRQAAQDLIDRLQPHAHATLVADAIDHEAPDFASKLASLAPQLVIHTAGPFQGGSYRVAEAALAARAHYIDLADGRDFVAGFHSLHDRATSMARWLITGASSVPGLSAAVIEAHLGEFAKLESVESAISPGNRTERGLATTRAILGYVGQPYPVLRDGRWVRAHGWQSLRRIHVDGHTRWVARCEVPDLEVLPARYPQLRTCDFRAGLELRRMHHGLWLASWLVRARLLRTLTPWSERLLAASQRWLDEGSDLGIMRVTMEGVSHDGSRLRLDWTLTAAKGDGPQVPATASVVLARKLARGQLEGGGARPCLDLFSLSDFMDALGGCAITAATTRTLLT